MALADMGAVALEQEGTVADPVLEGMVVDLALEDTVLDLELEDTVLDLEPEATVALVLQLDMELEVGGQWLYVKNARSLHTLLHIFSRPCRCPCVANSAFGCGPGPHLHLESITGSGTT